MACSQDSGNRTVSLGAAGKGEGKIKGTESPRLKYYSDDRFRGRQVGVVGRRQKKPDNANYKVTKGVGWGKNQQRPPKKHFDRDNHRHEPNQIYPNLAAPRKET